MSMTTDYTVSERRNSVGSPTDIGLLIVRLALGAIFIAHGAQKVFGAFGGQGLEGAVSGMAKTGIPAFLVYTAAFTEFFGGIAMVVGLFSRVAGLGLAIVMLVAMVKIHLPNGFFLASMGYEYNLALLAMSLLIVFAGPGRLAIADIEGRLLGIRR